MGRGHCCSPKVVVHKPLGAHNSAVSVMVPDHASVDPSRANALTLRLNRAVFLLDPLGELGGVRLCSILPDEMPPIEERVTAMGQEVRHRCRNIKPEDQPSAVRNSQQNSQRRATRAVVRADCKKADCVCRKRPAPAQDPCRRANPGLRSATLRASERVALPPRRYAVTRA